MPVLATHPGSRRTGSSRNRGNAAIRSGASADRSASSAARAARATTWLLRWASEPRTSASVAASRGRPAASLSACRASATGSRFIAGHHRNVRALGRLLGGVVPFREHPPRRSTAMTLGAKVRRASGLVVFLTATTFAAAQADQMTQARLTDAYRSLPFSFEPNLGQSDARVKFLARTRGITVFLTATDTVLSTGRTAVRMRLIGANSAARIAGIDALPGRSHSFSGRDPGRWRTDVPTYTRVAYRDIYPGIDLVYYGTQERQLEYDFVVGPGADPRAIRLAFDGVDRLELNRTGDLVLHVGDTSLRFGKPLVYQHSEGARRKVAGRWAFENRTTVGFHVGSYDARRPLVIDPTIALATYVGGAGTDQAFAIAVDASANVYLTGNTTSVDFPTTLGAFRTTPLGGSDAVVVKLNSAFTARTYSTYLGGTTVGGTTGDDAGRGIAVDATGNAYVTGFTASNDFPTTPFAFQTALAGGGLDAFVVKLNPAGS